MNTVTVVASYFCGFLQHSFIVCDCSDFSKMVMLLVAAAHYSCCSLYAINL